MILTEYILSLSLLLILAISGMETFFIGLTKMSMEEKSFVLLTKNLVTKKPVTYFRYQKYSLKKSDSCQKSFLGGINACATGELKYQNNKVFWQPSIPKKYLKRSAVINSPNRFE